MKYLKEMMIVLIVITIIYYVYRNEGEEGFKMTGGKEKGKNKYDTEIYGKYVSNYVNEEPKREFFNLIKEFGMPDGYINEAHGYALWKDREPYKYLVLKDEEIINREPYDHREYLYGIFEFKIDDDKLFPIMNTSQSVYYDKLKRLLTVRSSNTAAINVMTIIIYEMSKMSVSRAQETVHDFNDVLVRTLSEMNEERYQKAKQLLKDKLEGINENCKEEMNRYEYNIPRD